VAKIRVKLNTRQRDAMIRRKISLTRDLHRQPSASVDAEGFHAPKQGTSRGRGKSKAAASGKPSANIVILRTQIKRNAKRLKATQANLKQAYQSTLDVRELVLNGTVKVGALLRETGDFLSDRMKEKIQAKLTQRTGSLLASIKSRVHNA